MTRLSRLHLAAIVLLEIARTTAAAAPKEIILEECLVLPQVGRYGRTLVHLDPLEASIVSGKWKTPQAGDTVARTDGESRRWETARAKDGALEHRALQGGYAFWSVKSDRSGVAVLEARGHTLAYVNGELRVGDPYQNGIVRVPVLLHEGRNEFLFQCGRGQLRAKLGDPKGVAEIDDRDATLPDYRIGETTGADAAVVILNTSDKLLTDLSLTIRYDGADTLAPVRPLHPLEVRKTRIVLPSLPKAAGESVSFNVELLRNHTRPALATKNVTVRIRRPEQSYKRSFISDIDGSVQYFAVQPARADGPKPPALVLTLHGAGVEAIGQADAYASKDWCHIVAPTNRRPYGFDWEDWGRLDALEVLNLAKEQLQTDPQRTYLTGHSMGGHGAWQVGVTFPDLFAAVAPSAGWISFASYGGARRPENPTPMQLMLQRAGSPGDTLALLHNLERDGVYVLHGEADDNVPVTEARAMRKELGGFHSDFVYYERPGAGHWWGSECVDWPPLFEFLHRHSQPALGAVRHVDFTTASPGVSSRCDWLEIASQSRVLQPSRVDMTLDAEHRKFSGKTENVTRLSLDCRALPETKPVTLQIDGQTLADVAWPVSGGRLWLSRNGEKWAVAMAAAPSQKGPHRYGPFKNAFRNQVLLVYGTNGTDEENARLFAKARYDSEAFWYRGNASLEVCSDKEFDPAKNNNRNVILYGNADNNGAWGALLGDSPVQVKRGVVRIGDRTIEGDDLACLFLRPRSGNDRALVGVVSGSGVPGIRLTERIPYFVSGVGVPDCIVLGSDSLTRGGDGVRAAGFFGTDWKVESGDWVWQPTGPRSTQ